jgi:FixJ family two-component response regulator
MYISLQPNDFLKKDNSINYKSLLEIIKTRIKENADLTEKKEEENKITEKYNKLKDYFI